MYVSVSYRMCEENKSLGKLLESRTDELRKMTARAMGKFYRSLLLLYQNVYVSYLNAFLVVCQM